MSSLPKIKVVIPNGVAPSKLMVVLEALGTLEADFEVDIVIGSEMEPPLPVGGPGQGYVRDPERPRSPVVVPDIPNAFDLIDQAVPGSEEQDIVGRRRVVRDDS